MAHAMAMALPSARFCSLCVFALRTTSSSYIDLSEVLISSAWKSRVKVEKWKVHGKVAGGWWEGALLGAGRIELPRPKYVNIKIETKYTPPGPAGCCGLAFVDLLFPDISFGALVGSKPPTKHHNIATNWSNFGMLCPAPVAVMW